MRVSRVGMDGYLFTFSTWGLLRIGNYLVCDMTPCEKFGTNPSWWKIIFSGNFYSAFNNMYICFQCCTAIKSKNPTWYRITVATPWVGAYSARRAWSTCTTSNPIRLFTGTWSHPTSYSSATDWYSKSVISERLVTKGPSWPTTRGPRLGWLLKFLAVGLYTWAFIQGCFERASVSLTSFILPKKFGRVSISLTFLGTQNIQGSFYCSYVQRLSLTFSIVRSIGLKDDNKISLIFPNMFNNFPFWVSLILRQSVCIYETLNQTILIHEVCQLSITGDLSFLI